jgi:hypothetical protein
MHPFLTSITSFGTWFDGLGLQHAWELWHLSIQVVIALIFRDMPGSLETRPWNEVTGERRRTQDPSSGS